MLGPRRQAAALQLITQLASLVFEAVIVIPMGSERRRTTVHHILRSHCRTRADTFGRDMEVRGVHVLGTCLWLRFMQEPSSICKTHASCATTSRVAAKSQRRTPPPRWLWILFQDVNQVTVYCRKQYVRVVWAHVRDHGCEIEDVGW